MRLSLPYAGLIAASAISGLTKLVDTVAALLAIRTKGYVDLKFLNYRKIKNEASRDK